MCVLTNCALNNVWEVDLRHAVFGVAFSERLVVCWPAGRYAKRLQGARNVRPACSPAGVDVARDILPCRRRLTRNNSPPPRCRKTVFPRLGRQTRCIYVDTHIATFGRTDVRSHVDGARALLSPFCHRCWRVTARVRRVGGAKRAPAGTWLAATEYIRYETTVWRVCL